MTASKKDLINFEGSSAPFVQGRERERGVGEWGRTDPWTDQHSLQVGAGCCSPTVSQLKWNHSSEWQSRHLKTASSWSVFCCPYSPHLTPQTGEFTCLAYNQSQRQNIYILVLSKVVPIQTSLASVHTVSLAKLEMKIKVFLFSWFQHTMQFVNLCTVNLNSPP